MDKRARHHEPSGWRAAFTPLQLPMLRDFCTLKRRERRAPVQGLNARMVLGNSRAGLPLRGEGTAAVRWGFATPPSCGRRFAKARGSRARARLMVWQDPVAQAPSPASFGGVSPPVPWAGSFLAPGRCRHSQPGTAALQGRPPSARRNCTVCPAAFMRATVRKSSRLARAGESAVVAGALPAQSMTRKGLSGAAELRGVS
jgi:hypothetical protein